MSFKLREYQEEALRALESCNVRRPLVALPTGTGKTIIFAELIKRRGGRAVILAHRDELINQAVEKLEMVAPGLGKCTGVVKGERDETGGLVIVASVQTLSREKRLQSFLIDLRGHTLTVIVDEAHHAVADSYRKILDALAPQATMIAGFTATPERADSKILGDVWDRIIYSRTILEMISAGYLCDLKAKQVRLKDLDLGDVRIRQGDYDAGDLGAAMELANAPLHIVKAYQEYAAGRKAICFLPTVALAEEVTKAFEDTEVAATIVTGADDLEMRRRTLKDFAVSTGMSVISNCAVLTEGYDEPSVNCVIIARPTKSRPFYTQMIGRGTRRHPGKEDCLILDMVGATGLDLVTMASLFKLKESTAENGIASLLARVAAHEEAATAEGELIAEAVDVLRLQRLHWIPDGPKFLLSTGEETLMLFPEDLGWNIASLPRDRSLPRKLLYKGLTLEYAQGVAEDYVKELGAMGLAKAGAKWREAGPSEKQEELLRKWGLWRDGLTKGQASDMISVRMARRRAD